jgi:uncharacterized protein YciI
MFGPALNSLVRTATTIAFVATTRSGILLRHPTTTSTIHHPSTMAGAVYSSSGSVTALQATTQYLLQYDYIPDVLEKRGPYREGHLNLAKELIMEGKCLSGGPTSEVGVEIPTGALFIFTDEESAKAFVLADPYVSNGIVTGHKIQQWTVVVQKES